VVLSLNNSATTTEDKQDDTGYKDSELIVAVRRIARSACQLLLLIMGSLHMLFSIQPVPGLAFSRCHSSVGDEY
jgi:hypothetical protein